MKCMKTSFAFIIVLISLNSCQVNKEPELDVPTIPIVDFFRNPEKSGYSISPDGTHFAFMSPVKQRMNVFVQKIGSENSKQITFETSRSIADFFWKGNNHIMYLKDVGGDENYALYGTKIDSGSVRAYTQFDKVMTQIIDRLKDDANHIILGLNKRDSRVFDAYRLNINTGDLLLIAENPGSISGWMTDHEGKLRLATVTDGVNTSILYRKTELDVWDTVITTDFKESFNPQFFDFHDTAVVYGVSNIGRDKMALVRFDMSTGKEVEELYKNDNYDITGAAFSHKRKVLTSVFWIGEKAERSGFDPAIEQIYTQLQTELPGMEVYLTSRNEAENLYMVRTMNDRTRGSYYTYTVATKSLQKVADISPWLNPNVLSEMKPITYKS
jgi:hypothetical protein